MSLISVARNWIKAYDRRERARMAAESAGDPEQARDARRELRLAHHAANEVLAKIAPELAKALKYNHRDVDLETCRLIADNIFIEFYANIGHADGWRRLGGTAEIAARQTVSYLVKLSRWRFADDRRAKMRRPKVAYLPRLKHDADSDAAGSSLALENFADPNESPHDAASTAQMQHVVDEAFATSGMDHREDKRWVWEQRIMGRTYDEIVHLARTEPRPFVVNAKRRHLEVWTNRCSERVKKYCKGTSVDDLGEGERGSTMPKPHVGAQCRPIVPISMVSQAVRRGLVPLEAFLLPREQMLPTPRAPALSAPSRQASLPSAVEIEASAGKICAAEARREYALGSVDLPEGDISIDVFGDKAGLYARVTANGEALPNPVKVPLEPVSGYDPQIPIVVEGSGCRPEDLPPFRLGGPLRLHLASEPGRDRRYSARSYLVPVGESALRDLFDLTVATSGRTTNPTSWLHDLARSQGLETGDQLMQKVAVDSCLSLPWLRQAQTGARVRQETGASSLGEILDHLSDVSASLLGAEIDCLSSLRGDLAPCSGDSVVLLPTWTATSMVAARLVRQAVLQRFPGVGVQTLPFQEMREAPGLLSSRSWVSDQPVLSAISFLDKKVVEQLCEEGTDPVLVVTGGTKWQAGAMLEVALRRRLACAYKPDDLGGAEPWTFRADLVPPKRAASKPEWSGPARVVISVGISLLNRWRNWLATERGVPIGVCARELPPDADTLVSAVLANAGTREETWRASAELTSFEAWRRVRSARGGDADVVLVPTDSPEACLCSLAVQRLLERAGVSVAQGEPVAWLTAQPFDEARSASRLLLDGVIQPLERVLDAAFADGRTPELLAIGGQKVTSGLFQIAASSRGVPVFLAGLAADDEAPGLWAVSENPMPDPEIDAESMVRQPAPLGGDRP